MTFKRSILNRCQTEFEKEKTDEQQLEKEQSKHYENVSTELYEFAAPHYAYLMSHCSRRESRRKIPFKFM